MYRAFCKTCTQTFKKGSIGCCLRLHGRVISQLWRPFRVHFLFRAHPGALPWAIPSQAVGRVARIEHGVNTGFLGLENADGGAGVRAWALLEASLFLRKPP